MANHHLNEEKPSTKVSQSLLLGDNFLSPERKKFFTYTTQSETIEKGINTSPSTGFFHWILLINLSDSIFKIRIDENTCNSCGACAAKCKSSCIDSKEHQIDHSRCVGCFNCLPVCKKKAIKFTYAFASTSAKQDSKPNDSRRMFLSITGAGLITVPLLKAQNAMASLSKNKPYKKK